MNRKIINEKENTGIENVVVGVMLLQHSNKKISIFLITKVGKI